MDFIKTNWKQNHILARDIDFFKWMYVDEQGCNFILSFDDDGQINGMEGYIKYNKGTSPDIAGTMWKVLKTDNPMLGMEIGKKMYEVENVRADAAPGLTKRAMKINQIIGYLGGRLDHYYILADQEDYKLAVVEERKQSRVSISNKQFYIIDKEEQLKRVLDDDNQRRKAPYKDIDYLIHRYMQHPIYHYDLLGVRNEEEDVCCVIVGRMVEYNGARAYKIIDILGELKELIGTANCFLNWMQTNHLEYIDLYCFGVPEEYILSAGFSKREGDEVVIPNYFEPFERKNVDIYFASSVSEGLVLFRGDGDQDRPS